MTLTEILPTLRRSIPVPIAAHCWPVHTEPTTTDVVVGGISLMRLLEISDSPAILTGDLPRPRSQGTRDVGSGTDVSVLVFRITLRVDTQESKRIALTDCTFDAIDARWEECRLIGRASTSRNVEIELIPGEDGGSSWPHPTVSVPEDLREGDILTVPCAGAITLHDVRPKTARLTPALASPTARTK
ncbi:hypothetical protein LTA6_000551 [Microbacterium sp. LTA6]|uniref:hypothetical protein n=1 Tax=unclassified Microbacterium TaxID=2609290 RepID=UPI003138EFFC